MASKPEQLRGERGGVRTTHLNRYIGALAALNLSAGCIIAQNFELIQQARAYVAEKPDSMVIYSGCEHVVDIADNSIVLGLSEQAARKEVGEELETERGLIESQADTRNARRWLSAQNVESSSLKTETKRINLHESLRDFGELFDNDPFHTYRSPRTGMHFDFYTTDPQHFEINAQAFDELFLLAFDARVHYFDPAITENVACVREQFLKEKKFEGQRIPIYLHADRHQSMGNWRFSSVHKHSSGFTAPEIKVAFGPFTLFELPQSMIVTFGKYDDHELSRKTKKLLHHELTGHMWQRFVIHPTDLNRERDESDAEYFEASTRKLLEEIDDPIVFKNFNK